MNQNPFKQTTSNLVDQTVFEQKNSRIKKDQASLDRKDDSFVNKLLDVSIVAGNAKKDVPNAPKKRPKLKKQNDSQL